MQCCRIPFFVMIIGLCCTQRAYAMELENYDDKKNDIVINTQHFWSEQYAKDISQTKNLDLKTMRASLEHTEFLPAHSDELHHLLYLSTINNNNTVKTLFTQRQQNKFDACFKIKRSVPWSFGVNGVIIVGTSLLPFMNFTGLSQCLNATQTGCLSQVVTIMTPTVASVIGSLTVGFVSLYATGLSPDISSRSADKVQDEIWYLKDKYATIAKHWIDIYFDCPEKAQYIANELDIEALKTRAQLKTHKKKSGGSLVNPLEEAWHYIKNNTILIKFTEIENYIYNKISCGRIEFLEIESSLLKKIVLEQKTEIENLKNKKDI